MEIENIKNFLKSKNHVLIDYTDKFINSNDEIPLGDDKYMSKASQIFLDVHEKTKQHKYNNVVFLLDISKLAKYNYTFYKLLSKNEEWATTATNFYMMQNCNNKYIIPFGDFEKNKKIVLEVLINQKNDIYSCHVCYEEKQLWNELEYCKICNYRTCIKCILKAGSLNKKCFNCRTDTNDKYNVIYNLLSKYNLK